jgi:hypothetical protein
MKQLESIKKSVLKKIKFQEKEPKEVIEKKPRKKPKIEEKNDIENQTIFAKNIMTGKS